MFVWENVQRKKNRNLVINCYHFSGFVTLNNTGWKLAMHSEPYKVMQWASSRHEQFHMKYVLPGPESAADIPKLFENGPLGGEELSLITDRCCCCFIVFASKLVAVVSAKRDLRVRKNYSNPKPWWAKYRKYGNSVYFRIFRFFFVCIFCIFFKKYVFFF